ncbi:MAG: hypothetical protein JNG88_08335 [Phycisphaerales bacterium]|nr:hypothetical protein [Phycisphaerales bacterium]
MVTLSAGWTDPQQVRGDPGCNRCFCDQTDNAPYTRHENPSNATWLEVGFPNLTIPPCAINLHPRVKMIGRYDYDLDGSSRRVDWRLSLNGTVTSDRSCAFTQPSRNNGGQDCIAHDCLTIDLQGRYAWTPNDFNNNTMLWAVKRVPVGGEPREGSTSYLRIISIELIVDYEVPVPQQPSQASANPQSFCRGTASQVQLTATGGSGADVQWFTGGCGVNHIGNGVSIPVAAPTVTTAYYARWYYPGCSESPCATTTVAVYDVPDASIESNSPICANGTLTLIGRPNGMAAYTWTAPNGQQHTGQRIDVTPAAGTWTLAVRSSTNCTDSASTSIVVNAVPAAAIEGDTNVCVQETLHLTGMPPGMASYLWTAPNGTTYTSREIHVSPPIQGQWCLNVTSPQGCSAPACASVTVRTRPNPPTNVDATPRNACGDEAITLHADANGALCIWSTTCDGPPVFQGETYVIPSPHATVTYFARARNECGDSECVAVQLVAGGDANCDGLVNDFDIGPFAFGISNGIEAWAGFYQCDALCALDMNRNGRIDNFDIDPFVDCLVRQSCP